LIALPKVILRLEFLRLSSIKSSVLYNQVSAKKGTNIDALLENIVLVAEVIFDLPNVVFYVLFYLRSLSVGQFANLHT